MHNLPHPIIPVFRACELLFREPAMVKIPKALLDRLTDALAYAA